MLCIKVVHITETESTICIAKTEKATCITETKTATFVTETESVTCNKISEYFSWVSWVHFSQIIFSIYSKYKTITLVENGLQDYW